MARMNYNRRTALTDEEMEQRPGYLDPNRRRRRLASRSFEALYNGECAACGGRITVGQTVHFNSGDDLVHDRHEAEPERTYTICPRCHLAKPCECD